MHTRPSISPLSTMNLYLSCLLLVVVSTLLPSEGSRLFKPFDSSNDEPQSNGTTWAVLFAGSNGYGNYRHQADVCHAYQILKRGGLKDENVVVFMYDDIANNTMNPHPGTIINNPHGGDVYAGVPKDYTGYAVTAANLYAVLLGDATAVKGGSGKVVASQPNDRIFVYYTDHGGPGILGTPNGPFIFANDLIATLEKKHASGTYKEMVIYVEACESGSIFDGLLSQDLNIFVTTASNPNESSWATYCPGMNPPPPPEYATCLGDLYSISWMEDSDSENLRNETLQQQYEKVKLRTYNNHSYFGSHVMEYGTQSMSDETVSVYQGCGPTFNFSSANTFQYNEAMEGVDQRDADIFSMWERYKKLTDGQQKKEALKEITEIMAHRVHLDSSVESIGVYLFGHEHADLALHSLRSPGLPVVDDWACLKSTVRTFETHCGVLTQYGMKHMRAFANICNNGINNAAMEEASATTCSGYDMGQWNPLTYGYSS